VYIYDIYINIYINIYIYLGFGGRLVGEGVDVLLDVLDPPRIGQLQCVPPGALRDKSL